MSLIDFDNRSTIECIASFRNSEQLVIQIWVSNDIGEKALITRLMESLSTEMLQDLIKFSICQYVDEPDDQFDYLATTRGKYYFNPETNPDNETSDWTEHKNTILAEKVTANPEPGSE